MKQSEQIAKLQQRVSALEAHASAGASDQERNWLIVYSGVLGALVIARRAVTDEQLLALEGIAGSAASRACGSRKADDDE